MISVEINIKHVENLSAVRSTNKGIKARKKTVPFMFVRLTKKPCKSEFKGLYVLFSWLLDVDIPKLWSYK